MKKIILSLGVLSLLFASCQNGESDFPDYSTQSVYFPVQYPVRTLVLGDDRYDNAIDQEHAFSIGVCIGGMYENTKNWMVDFAVDTTLVYKIAATDANNVVRNIKMLPSSYYSLVPDSSVVIPKGSFSGLFRVNLKDAFFEDTASYKLTYVLPLRIVSSTAPAVNRGTVAEGITNPNVHRSSDWVANKRCMDYTLFAIKFINPWHGTFFQRGKQYKANLLDTIFHNRDLELNQTAQVVTAGYKKALYKRMGLYFGDNYATMLTFSNENNGSGDIEVSTPTGSPYVISGTGKYYKSTTDFAKQYGSWLADPKTGVDKPHLTMTLDFTVNGLNSSNYHFVDTLVFRDNGMRFELFTPTILP